MAGNTPLEQVRFGLPKDTQGQQFSELSDKFSQLLDYLKGGDIGAVSGSPIELGRSVIKDIKKGQKEYRASELPSLYSRYERDISANRISPEQASAAYEAAARGAGQTKGVIETASRLAERLPGAPSEKLYERYTPFFQGTAQSMLGRTFTEPEIQNYVSMFRGMGIKNPNDVSAAFGKMLTTSDEYLDRQYRFRPDMPTLGNEGVKAFQQMLNTSIG